jgi:biotin transport system substrate-specific component
MAIASQTSLIQKLDKTYLSNSYLRDIILIILGSGLLAISAQYKIPYLPVPATLQSFVVMMIATFFGWRLGALTIIAYWVEGILVGGLFSFLPWFANGSGIGYFLLAPTAGFLWGFLPMVLIIGYCCEVLNWRKSPLMLFISLTLGQGVLYLFGLTQAYLFILPAVTWMNSTQDLFNMYFYPFIYGDIIKSFLCTLIAYEFYNRAVKT